VSEAPRYIAPSAVGPELMAQVRALYEDSDVSVREIARRAGVTERTLYKYVERHAWRRRYKWGTRGMAAAAANRGVSWQAGEGFAAAKGAGGRFVRREDAGTPHASGLQALDPAARAKAEADCAEAARLARRAALEAECHKLERNRWRALNGMNAALARIIKCRKELPRAQQDPNMDAMLLRSSVDVLTFARLAHEECQARLKAEIASSSEPACQARA
jgi:transposase-like protein